MKTISAQQSFDEALQYAKRGGLVSYEDLAFLLQAAMRAQGKELGRNEALYVIQTTLPRLLAK